MSRPPRGEGPLGILAWCAAAQLALSLALPSAWLVPNLMLAGMVLAVIRTPGQWLLAAWLAGLFTMLWAIRFPAQLFVLVLLLGGVIRAAAQQWGMDAALLQAWLTVGSSACLTFGELWLEDLWSWRLVGRALAQVALTGIAGALMARLVSGTARRPWLRRAR